MNFFNQIFICLIELISVIDLKLVYFIPWLLNTGWWSLNPFFSNLFACSRSFLNAAVEDIENDNTSLWQFKLLDEVVIKKIRLKVTCLQVRGQVDDIEINVKWYSSLTAQAFGWCGHSIIQQLQVSFSFPFLHHNFNHFKGHFFLLFFFLPHKFFKFWWPWQRIIL